MNTGQNKRDGSWERSPLTPRHDTSTSYGGVGQVPRQPGVQPPPPYLAAPGCSYGGYQAANTSNYQRDPSPPPAKITTGRCTAGIIILVILVAQLVAFVLFYDLPTKIDRWSEAVSRMRVREEAMRKERLALQEERERWEKAREDRVPQGAFWETVWPAWDCRSYGKREYWGVLRNIPEDWTDIDACMNTPVEINGVAVRRPHRCQYVEGSPHIHGFWMVDWDQLDCQPWHQDFNDKGCTNRGSGIRRIEARVVGINSKGHQDWRLLCDSTPMTWNHITYNTPTHCDDRLGRKVAMWDIPDYRC